MKQKGETFNLQPAGLTLIFGSHIDDYRFCSVTSLLVNHSPRACIILSLRG